MKYYSQVRYGEIKNIPLITVWRWCKSGKIKTQIFEVFHKGGKLVQTPLIPETEV